MGTEPSMVETGGEADHVPGVEMANGKDAAAETPEHKAEDNIYKRLLNARAAAKRMEKRGVYKDKSGKEQYRFVIGDDITNEGNRLFVEYGICPIPTAIDRHEEPLAKGIKTTIKCALQCVNIDHPDESVTFEAWGTGIDYSDKGDGKAFSYAVKNATAKAIGLNTSDDIEQENVEYIKRASDAEIAQERAGAQQTLEMWASAFKRALEGAQSVSDLDEIWKEGRKRLNADDVPEVTFNFMSDLYNGRRQELGE